MRGRFVQEQDLRLLCQRAGDEKQLPLAAAEARDGVGLILMGWRGQLSTRRGSGRVVKDVVHSAPYDVAVLRDPGVMEEEFDGVVVPVGGNPHARLALRLA